MSDDHPFARHPRPSGDGSVVSSRSIDAEDRWRRRRARRWLASGALALFLASIVVSTWILERWPSRGGWFAAEPTVVDSIDGDTIDVRIGRRTVRVRLLGIDTPETKDPRKPVQCFGRDASEHTAALLPPGTVVRLERDREEHDAYGRTLAYVHRAADGLFVNLDLAQGGYADVLSIAPNTTHADTLRAAVDDARRNARGLWGACGGPGRPAD